MALSAYIVLVADATNNCTLAFDQFEVRSLAVETVSMLRVHYTSLDARLTGLLLGKFVSFLTLPASILILILAVGNGSDSNQRNAGSQLDDILL